MAGTKRSIPKEFEVPPLQAKQPRIEGVSPITTSQTPASFVFPARSLSLPLQAITTGRTAMQSQNSAALIGITGILPTSSPIQASPFEFPTQVSPSFSAPSVLPLAANLAGLTPSPPVTPYATAIGIPGIQQPRTPPAALHAQPHFATAVPVSSFIRPGAVSTPIIAAGSALVAGSPITTPTLPSAPPPPYPIVQTSSGGEHTSEEFSCSSPSQFLHSPTSLRPLINSQATIASTEVTTTETGSRQPVCTLVTTSCGVSLGEDKSHSLKSRVLKFKKMRLAALKQRHDVYLRERFFLEGGSNMMEFVLWKRKPNILRDQYLSQRNLDSETVPYEEVLSPKDLSQSSNSAKMDTLRDGSLEVSDSRVDTSPQKHPREAKTSKQRAISQQKLERQTPASSTTIQIPLSTITPGLQATTAGVPASTPKSTPTSPATKSLQLLTPSPRPATRAHASFTSVYESSHEDIVMRARHEAEVVKAIAELRREGIWSSSRLPKVHEPPRRKTQWDYLLEEMQWLAADFANERRWKMAAAKKLCRSVVRHHQELETQQVRTEKDELLRLKKIASSIAKEVKHFWDSIHKIVEHKQRVLLEEKRKKAMDMHLEFIVDQTAKYSNWLVKGLASHTPSEPSLQSAATSHDDSSTFSPLEESDDEETIDMEESQAQKDGAPDYTDEIRQLEAEGEIPIDQLLSSLPPEIFEGRAMTPTSSQEEGEGEGGEEPMEAEAGGTSVSGKAPATKKEVAVKERRTSPRKRELRESTKESGKSVTARAGSVTRAGGSEVGVAKAEVSVVKPGGSEVGVAKDREERGESGGDGGDSEYLASESEGEDETTIAEQETHEGAVDHHSEVSALEKEGDLPLEDLLRLYNLQPNTSVEATRMEEGEETPEGEGSGSSSEGEEEEEEEEKEGLEFLVSGKHLAEACQTEEGLSNVAAAAEQFQPKGITFATTEVKTKVPFLLRHKLREYQHIGLEWLVAMDERRLNGILADEMGLGKTMQTIALLAHMACEKCNWGPHLIIVSTSVMLNWEFEFKKWCPAFKILTYFGSLKERKQKRVGWSKQNTFHVCITSYNIAVQDHRAFKQKRWKYLILDEAQNIKNFKSQRWQTLLGFNSQRRLLLTGTPLQNNLMELWSLMHFLMPAVFSSHTDFKEWFSNPLTGMVEGSQEYNDSIIRRLHQVLRPFLLRRLKMEVEKQMPKKYEHVVLCRLSKRQRFLYDEYMSRAKTKDSLTSGNYLSVINILMQLRKVCNHPDLFEPRPTLSPLRLAALEYYTASLALKATEYEPLKHINLDCLNLHLADYELDMEAFAAFRCRQLQAQRALILDPSSSSHPYILLREMEAERKRKTDRFLEDLHLPSLMSQRDEWELSCRKHMYEVNTRQCHRQPMYGTDLVRAVRCVCRYEPRCADTGGVSTGCHWLWVGHAACALHQARDIPWDICSTALRAALLSYQQRAELLQDVTRRFVITVPPATTPPITMHAHHPDPSWMLHEAQRVQELSRELSPRADFFHPIATSTCFQFPETRLIQYDCGKLQTLGVLLQRLKAEGHRVLLFTQMARILDVLEIFLNYHGHTYLRLDGATPPQKRQILMERFNRDERVFCFILSTRSGGLGVNLIGADTVIFYDSDWNPTMDAQAQDRCHRIGQTRDVHIYRLVCERTVEENILKKANQKRMLGDIAIEGGAFTTDFFKQACLRELFKVGKEEPQDLMVLPPSSLKPTPSSQQTPTTEQDQPLSQKQIEELLMQAEDDNDVKAANLASAEQVAEMAEFDENFSSQISLNSKEVQPKAECSKALAEFARIEEQLNGVELYAMKYLEEENAEFAAAQLRLAEENIELAKKDWELSHLQSLREEEERLAEVEVQDVMLTYDRPETSNKIYVDAATGEEMPIWLPPTPPSDDAEDLYVDLVMEMSYDTQSTMSVVFLASTVPYSDDDYDVFGLWRKSTIAEPLKKTHKSTAKQTKEHVNVPPSLFWRRLAADSLSTKLKKLSTHSKKLKSKDQFTPLLEQQPEGPDWSHVEDWILLKGITTVLEFPLTLTISVPAQIPNWSIVADLTSTLSRIRRSPLQCREHLMNVVIPREDHTIKVDEPEHKKYKSRDGSVKKTKSRRDQRTKNLVIHDNGKNQTKQFSQCFEWVLQASSKRKQASKFAWEPQKPSMHSDLLKDYGIHMDSVQSPMQIALQRAERIQSELPKHSQVHQLLAGGQSQPYHLQMAARGYHTGAAYIKPTATDLAKAGFALPRQLPTVSVASAPQRFQANSGITFSPSKLPSVSSSIPSSLSLPAATQTPASAAVSHTTSLANTVNKAYSVSSGMDLGKTIMPLAPGRGLTQQQFLLLRQTALQQQQQQQQPPSQIAQLPQPQTAQPPQPQTITVQRKVPSLPSAVTLPLQRFSTTGNVRGIPATGRSLQTEEVLALLKQQSLRMAAQPGHVTAAVAAAAAQFPGTSQLRFHTDGGLQQPAKLSPSIIANAPEGAKYAAPSPMSVEGGAQLKVELVDQNQLQKKPPPPQQQQQQQQQQQLQQQQQQQKQQQLQQQKQQQQQQQQQKRQEQQQQNAQAVQKQQVQHAPNGSGTS